VVEQELTVMLVMPALAEREALRSLVEKDQGLRVVCEAEDAEAALTLGRQFKPDIAIIDHGLPSASPLDLVHLLSRTSPATQSLVFTNHVSRDWIIAALRAGVRAFVLKSDAGSRLLPALDALGDHRPYWQGAVDQEIADELLQEGSPIQQAHQDAVEEARGHPLAPHVADTAASNDTLHMRLVLMVLILGLALAVWVFIARP
jgi:DNA-binding NarL/FixJ family response regulator